VVALQLRGVHPVKVVGTEILKRHAIAEYVVADDQNAVRYGMAARFGPRRLLIRRYCAPK
jgi:hypothetical protein